MNIGVLYHPHKPEAKQMAPELQAWLTERGIISWLAPAQDPAPAGKISESGLVIVLGGDGTTLFAARNTAPYEVPLFGINLGRVGFLSEASPGDWREHLSVVLQGDFWRERRLMLKAVHKRDDQVLESFVALNDIVIGRGKQARVVRFQLFVDGEHITNYMADALIAATPSGSTAYAMAAGGPLLPPQLNNFLVVPVAPHLSVDRPLVLPENATVSVIVEMHHEATLTVDGQDGVDLMDGDEIVVTKHDLVTCFARVSSPNYFYHRLMAKFGYWHPK